MAYRAWATMGQLRHEGAATGVIYGIGTQLEKLVEEYATPNLVCCFDGGYAHRTATYPPYKADRRAKRELETEEEKQGRAELAQQLYTLRTQHLPAVGVQNILWAEGFEGDDHLASAAHAIPLQEKGTILSSDEDLWQCLRPGLRCYAPTSGKVQTYHTFKDAYGMEPKQWASVKAWAGCSGDNVAGVPGVGTVWACRYVRGEVLPGHKRYNQFYENHDIFHRNIKLVELPHAQLPPVVLHRQTEPLLWSALYKAIGARHGKGQTTAGGLGFSRPG